MRSTFPPVLFPPSLARSSSLSLSFFVVYLVVMNRLPAQHCSSHKEGTLSPCPSFFISIHPSPCYLSLSLLLRAHPSVSFSSSSTSLFFPLFTLSCSHFNFPLFYLQEHPGEAELEFTWITKVMGAQTGWKLSMLLCAFFGS